MNRILRISQVNDESHLHFNLVSLVETNMNVDSLPLRMINNRCVAGLLTNIGQVSFVHDGKIDPLNGCQQVMPVREQQDIVMCLDNVDTPMPKDRWLGCKTFFR
jgi:hypothetical protein